MLHEHASGGYELFLTLQKSAAEPTLTAVLQHQVPASCWPEFSTDGARPEVGGTFTEIMNKEVEQRAQGPWSLKGLANTDCNVKKEQMRGLVEPHLTRGFITDCALAISTRRQERSSI